MKGLIERYERFLRIPADAPFETVMRMRAVWLIGLMAVVWQSANLVVMSFSYGRWTYDHTIVAVAIVVVAAAVQTARWWKNAFAFAMFYTALTMACTLASALPDHTGIHSAIVPFITLGPVMTGFMAGRRAAVIVWAAGLILLSSLYLISLSHPPVLAPFDYTRETNRFFQSVFALSVAMSVAVMISEQILAAFTEQRAAADRARRAEAAKSEFLATMSHELRTPLNGVIGLTDALAGGNLPPRERKLVEVIRESGEALLLILNDLLDLSKIEAGRLTIEPRQCCPRVLLRSVVEHWRETAEAKGLVVKGHVTGDIPEAALLDDLRVGQILHNLLSNAVKFTDQGIVSAHLNGTSVGDGLYQLDFRVTDTGRGVPEELKERIFQPFEQGESGTTRRYGGTGLGLPICRMLATLMDGTIALERTGEKGTTFRLSLPARAAAPGENEPCAEAANADMLRTLKVLVAEDNKVNQLVVNEFLKSWGVVADFVEDGAACVEQVKRREYDLILMDKHMPRMNGIDATRAIRALGGRCAATPIIAVTADAMAGERNVMLAAGVNGFLAKPLRADALREAITRVLEARKAA